MPRGSSALAQRRDPFILASPLQNESFSLDSTPIITSLRVSCFRPSQRGFALMPKNNTRAPKSATRLFT